LNVGGHLNLSLIGGFEFDGTIIAAKGVSGLNASTTDTILVNNVNIEGQIISSGDIASITLNNADIFGGTLDAKNIGTIHFGTNADLTSGTILASEDLAGLVTRNAGLDLSNATIVVGDTIGLLDVAGGDLEGSITAANVTQITVRGGAMAATILATNSIGDVTITDGSLTGSLIAEGSAGIGAISVVDIDAAGNGAIDGATIYSGGTIESITASTAQGNGVAIGGSTNINALGTVGAITATAYGSTGTGIKGLTFVAPSISGVTAYAPFGIAMDGANTFISTTGSIGNISATGLNGGILNTGGNTSLNSATTVGTVTGTALNTGAGIQGLVINAQTGISAITGKAFSGDGINGGSFNSLSGTISSISGSSTSMSGTGDGIVNLDINAVNGSVADITGASSGITGGHGLNTVDVNALTGIGTITGNAVGGDGILNGSYTVTGDNANITAVVATTSTGTAINGAEFSAVGGTISTITATPTGAGGNAIDGATFEAEYLGNVSVTVSNLDGGFAINDSSFTAIAGAIGDITVVNKSLGTNFDAYGIGGNSDFTASNGIGAISVTVAANSTGGTVAAIQDKGAGAANRPDFNADSDGDGTGNIASVSVISTGSGIAGISGATFTAEDITGNFSVAMNGLNAGDAINKGNDGGAQLTVLNLAGDLGGNISVVNSSLDPFSDGLQDVKLNIAGNVVGTTTITAAGGWAMNNASIDPVDMGDITLDGETGAMTANSEIVTTGAISKLTVTGDIKAGSSIEAGSFNTANTLTITGDLEGDITSDAAIGGITITGEVSGNIEAGTTIGAILVTGDIIGGNIKSGQAVGATTGTITSITTTGDMSAAVLATVGDISLVTVGGDLTGNVTATVGNVGAITVTGDLTGNVEATAGSIAKVDVTGDMTNVGTSLKAGTTIAEIIVDGDVTGDIQSGTAVGATTGAITSLTVGGDLSGDVTASVGNIGAVEVTGDFTSAIEATKGNVANSKFGTVNTGAEIIAGSAGNAGTIGTITITANDTNGQAITLNAFKATTGGSIGSISAILQTTAAQTLAVTIGNDADSFGGVTASSSTGDINVTISGGDSLTSIGSYNTDGNLSISDLTTTGGITSIGSITAKVWTIPSAASGNLTGVSSLGAVNIASIATVGGAPLTIGSGITPIATAGAITITSSVTGGQDVTFEFDVYGAVSVASAGVTPVAAPGANPGGNELFFILA
jgi:hypothetical protein